MKRMKNRKNLRLAVVGTGIATIVAGLAAAGGVAAARAISPNEESEPVIANVAGQLGVEPDALAEALKQALRNRIGAAVEAGRLTEAQGG